MYKLDQMDEVERAYELERAFEDGMAIIRTIIHARLAVEVDWTKYPDDIRTGCLKVINEVLSK